MSRKPDSPIISVVLPVFNAAPFVERAIRSILQQSVSDFELIVINDGSTDASLELLERLQAQDVRIILLSRENKGLVATLNEGILMAQGQWLARMDADDIALPQRFEQQLRQLEQTASDICGSWVQHFGTTDQRVIQYPQSDAAIKAGLLFNPCFAHPTVIVRTSLIKQFLYDPEWEKCEDYDLWERAARAGWKMTNVPAVLLHYRQHSSQISTASLVKQHALTQKIRHRYWTHVFETLQLDTTNIDAVLNLRENAPSETDLPAADRAFNALLQCHKGESRAVIFDNITRLYFRAAALNTDSIARWGKLNTLYGKDFALGTKTKLWFLRTLSIHPHSNLFRFLKKIHFFWTNAT